MVFISWQLKKTIFMVLGGPNGALGAFWLILGLKRAIFGQFSIKIKVLNFLKICLYSKTIKKHIKIFQMKVWPTKTVKRASKSFKNCNFRQKKCFFSKKFGKIHTYAQKRLQYGLKWFQEDTLDDTWCPQTIFFSKWGCRGPQFLFIGQKWYS